MSSLLHKQYQVWIIGVLDDSSEVHRVVYLILSLKDFLEAEVVMAFFKCVKCDVLVVLGENICILTSCVLQYIASVLLARARRRLSKYTVVGLLGFLNLNRRLGLRRLNAEAFLHGDPVVATAAAVSHFLLMFNVFKL